MKIVFKKVFRFNLDTLKVIEIELEEDKNDFNSYIEELLLDVYSNSRSKKFLFPEESTFIKNQIVLTLDGKVNETTLDIAKRLLREETNIQKKIDHLDKQVQKGILIQSIVEIEERKYFIICKAEHQDFINEQDNKKAKGLPVKKKIFKSFCAHLNEYNLPLFAMVTDSGSSIAPYWWRNFLELVEERTDEYNTTESFNTLDRKIFSNLKDKYSEDYMNLRNSTVHFFRANEEFIMEDYLDRIIRNYIPVNENLKMIDIETKIIKLPESSGFDNRFKIIHHLLTQRMISKNIKLNAQLELVIKQDINLGATVRGFIQDGVKYIKIRTEEGYKYFPKDEEE